MPAHAEAEPQSSAGEVLERRGFLRQPNRVVQRKDEGGGSEPHALGEPGDPPEHGQRLEDARECVPRLGADDDVLRRPHGVEPELLG